MYECFNLHLIFLCPKIHKKSLLASAGQISVREGMCVYILSCICSQQAKACQLKQLKMYLPLSTPVVMENCELFKSILYSSGLSD